MSACVIWLPQTGRPGQPGQPLWRLRLRNLSPCHTGLTTRLRPTDDRKMVESWANRRKNERPVAEGVGGSRGKISRSKVVGMFKNS